MLIVLVQLKIETHFSQNFSLRKGLLQRCTMEQLINKCQGMGIPVVEQISYTLLFAKTKKDIYVAEVDTKFTNIPVAMKTE